MIEDVYVQVREVEQAKHFLIVSSLVDAGFCCSSDCYLSEALSRSMI